MKKILLMTFLLANLIIADSWISGWEIGDINTYEVSNIKGDTLKISCSDNFSSFSLNDKGTSEDDITIITNDNRKVVAISHLSNGSEGISTELAFNNLLYELSQTGKVKVILGKERAEFDILKNNINDEIIPSCGYERFYEEDNSSNISNWQSFIENGIKTYVLLNDNADSVGLACNSNYTVISFNNEGGNKNIITAINENNFKFETKTLIENKLTATNKDASLNYFLHEISKEGNITIKFNGNSASFNVGVNNVNSEIIQNCGY
ncbi:hypothetical protein [Aliarcobacter butzleri]|uniref:hypothetical protein n=1 Tax=Aliarcobacter butzleri TaxID=28197 RepID=UPI003AF97404